MQTKFDCLCELVIESRDPAATVEFYERLDLPVVGREGDRVWLGVGSRGRIGIWPPGEQEHHDRGGRHVHFALAAAAGGFDATVARLREQGLDFEGPVTHRGGDRSIYLFDPGGNRVEVWDYLEDHEGLPA